MEKANCLDGIHLERHHAEAKIMDSPQGYKLVIPMYHEAVPFYYRKVIMTAIEAFLKVHSMVHGAPLESDKVYAEGHLAVYLDGSIPSDKKYRLFVVILAGNDKGDVLEMPVRTTDARFWEFRQCIMKAFGKMIGG